MLAMMSETHLSELQEICFSLKAENFDKNRLGNMFMVWGGRVLGHKSLLDASL